MGFISADNVKTKKYLVTLDEDTVGVARELGEGNLSLGLRRLAVASTELKSSSKTGARRKRAVMSYEEYEEKWCSDRQVKRPSIATVRTIKAEYDRYVKENS